MCYLQVFSKFFTKMALTSIQDRAIDLVSPIKYHQSYTLTDEHGPLKVTYAIAGAPIGEDAPTILLCGGMLGTRYGKLTRASL
jgi:hypothetical protein